MWIQVRVLTVLLGMAGSMRVEQRLVKDILDLTGNATDDMEELETGSDKYCGCMFDLLYDYSVGVAHYPHTFGAPEKAKEMKGLQIIGGKANRRYRPKDDCGGTCKSLDKCKNALLVGWYNGHIKQAISEADLDAKMFDIKRHYNAAGRAHDCATYKRHESECACYTHGNKKTMKTFHCPWYEKQGVFASMTPQVEGWMPKESFKCEEHSCNEELGLTGGDRLLTCTEVEPF